MTGAFLSHIDWQQPWLTPLRELAAPIVAAADWRLAINAAAEKQELHNHRSLPVRFVPQSDLPAGTPYETYISETGSVPTRDNLHDFFNALIWLAYPLTKARLNELQAEAIGKAGITAVRGRLRDALTLFDENAAVFIAYDNCFIEALRNHQWKELFIEKRATFGQQYAVHLFGHALIEKLVTPYKAITAHAWPLVMEDSLVSGLSCAEQRAWLDRALVKALSAEIGTRDFMPLPVLGIPGWEEGQDENFYSDAKVFRAQRMSR